MSACSVQALPNGPRTPIRVNGVTISRAVISREVQNHPAPTPGGAWKAAALALVLREALSQEAKRMGIRAEPAVDAEGRRETDEEACMRALVEREATVPEPTEEECRRYHARNLARFRSPDIFEVSHILFSARADDATGYALARLNAETAIAVLKTEPDAFEDLARAHSACPSGELGGSLGQVTPRQTTPEFEAALRCMSPGQVSAEPVETRYGFHVIRLSRRIEGATLPFDAVRTRIAAYLCEAVRRRAEAQYVVRLLGQAQVEGIEIPAPTALNVH